MCGISGYVGDKPADVNKLKLLGIYNITRGTDACGVVINNKVKKGVDKLGTFSDFIEKNNLVTHASDENKIVLIHTRSASVKSTKDDIDCAHPIVVKSKKNKVQLIGVHNGTISNASKLAKQYNVKEGKIDSITLMNIIATSDKNTKNEKVFEDYEGAATVMWFHPDKPNELKIFKGASRDSYSEKYNLVEERPLYVYKEDEKTFYFSSIKESLYAIGGNINNVSTVPFNCIITIKPGEKFKVKPVNRTKVETFTNFSGSNYTTYGPSNYRAAVTIKPTKTRSEQLILAEKLVNTFKGYNMNILTANQFPKVSKNGKKILIENEPFILDQGKYGAKVTFWRGRYTRNGHIIGTKLDTYEHLRLDMYGFSETKQGKPNPDVDLHSLDDYYFYQGFLFLSKSHADEFFEREKVQPFIFTNKEKREFNIINITKYFFGFVANYNDDYGNARSTSTSYATGTYFPMFDYTRRYKFTTGTFDGAEIVASDSKTTWDVIKSFENTPALPPTVKQEEVKSIVVTTPNYNSAFDDEDEDKLYNLVQDSKSSLNAVVQEIDNNQKYAALSNKIKAFVGLINKTYEQCKEGKLKSPLLVDSNNVCLYS